VEIKDMEHLKLFESACALFELWLGEVYDSLQDGGLTREDADAIINRCYKATCPINEMLDRIEFPDSPVDNPTPTD
jgi:hypothetical protein